MLTMLWLSSKHIMLLLTFPPSPTHICSFIHYLKFLHVYIQVVSSPIMLLYKSPSLTLTCTRTMYMTLPIFCRFADQSSRERAELHIYAIHTLKYHDPIHKPPPLICKPKVHILQYIRKQCIYRAMIFFFCVKVANFYNKVQGPEEILVHINFIYLLTISVHIIILYDRG